MPAAANTPYAPRPGSVAYRVLAWLEQQPAGSEHTTSQIAEALGLTPDGVPPCLEAARDHGLVNGRRRWAHPKSPIFWSLPVPGAAPRAPSPPPADEAATWNPRRPARTSAGQPAATATPAADIAALPLETAKAAGLGAIISELLADTEAEVMAEQRVAAAAAEAEPDPEPDPEPPRRRRARRNPAAAGRPAATNGHARPEPATAEPEPIITTTPALTVIAPPPAGGATLRCAMFNSGELQIEIDNPMPGGYPRVVRLTREQTAELLRYLQRHPQAI